MAAKMSGIKKLRPPTQLSMSRIDSEVDWRMAILVRSLFASQIRNTVIFWSTTNEYIQIRFPKWNSGWCHHERRRTIAFHWHRCPPNPPNSSLRWGETCQWLEKIAASLDGHWIHIAEKQTHSPPRVVQTAELFCLETVTCCLFELCRVRALGGAKKEPLIFSRQKIQRINFLQNQSPQYVTLGVKDAYSRLIWCSCTFPAVGVTLPSKEKCMRVWRNSRSLHFENSSTHSRGEEVNRIWFPIMNSRLSRWKSYREQIDCRQKMVVWKSIIRQKERKKAHHIVKELSEYHRVGAAEVRDSSFFPPTWMQCDSAEVGNKDRTQP